MGTTFKRGNRLWLKFKDESGKWRNKASGYDVGQERDALRLLKRVEDLIAAGKDYSEAMGPLTVRQYSVGWLKERKALGLADIQSDTGRLKNHILPIIGHMGLHEVRPGDLSKLFKDMRMAEKPLAPASIYNVYSVVKAMFRDALIADLITTSPAVLTKYQLGPKEDKDPEWRAGAVFSRGELQTLISDEQIPHDRQVVYALLGIAGLRHGEAAGLRWRHYEPDLQPLGRLTIATSYDKGRTKTGRTRYMPVHPTLAAMLAEWKMEGWPAIFGHAPGPDDLVVPVPPGAKAVAGTMRKAHNTWLAFQGDLDGLELRRRRVHDLRRTLISLARMDGARASILKVCTHGASKQAMMDAYTTFPWKTLCVEVGKLTVKRVGRSEVVRLPVAACAGDLGTVGGTNLGTVRKKARVSESFLASPTGFEPVSPA